LQPVAMTKERADALMAMWPEIQPILDRVLDRMLDHMRDVRISLLGPFLTAKIAEARREEAALFATKIQAIAEHLSCPISMTLLTDPVVGTSLNQGCRSVVVHLATPFDLLMQCCDQGGCG
jgi:hypothetical protein